MEFFILLGIAFIFLSFVFLQELFRQKKAVKHKKEELRRDYGIYKERKYAPERFERMGSYFEKHRTDGDYIDDITWNDLGMDDLFKRMNFTHSATGEEYLYYLLRDMNRSEEELKHFEELVQFFASDEEKRIRLQTTMCRLGYTGKYSLYDYLDNLDYLGERSNKKHVLGILALLPFSALLPVYFPIGLFGLIIVTFANMGSYFTEKKKIEPYFISFVYLMKLLKICDELVSIPAEVCQTEWEDIKKNRGIMRGMERGAFLIFQGSATMSGNPLDIIFDYLRMVTHVDIIQFNRMYSCVCGNRETIDRLISNIGLVEAAVSVGEYRKSLVNGYCLPEFLENKSLEIEEGYHPMLSAPVKNSLTAARGILLTGSNASGKSTFLKMIAINMILARTIHTCAAKRFVSAPFHVMSSMSLRDNLGSGESYYIVEIKALKRVLERAKQADKRPLLCFVDEVLRGTNTMERIAAATQILVSLAAEQSLCFAATHDLELADLLKKQYDDYHFEEEIRDNDVYFAYQLLPGKATTRNAIQLLKLIGYEETIIGAAQKMAEEFEQSGIWKNVN